MKTIELKIYSFDELSEEAQQTAIEKNYLINVEFDWWESTYHDAKQIGLKITSFDLDRDRHAKGKFLLSACEVAQNILNNHGENCETFKTATNFLNEWNPIFAQYMDQNSEHYESSETEGKMQDLESDFLNDILEDYSIILQNECKYLQSEEAIKETLICNDFEFLESGENF
jgi:hypothetical protein